MKILKEAPNRGNLSVCIAHFAVIPIRALSIHVLVTMEKLFAVGVNAQSVRDVTTLETTTLVVAKRSGAMEPFSRDKVIEGVRKASSGRPISPDQLALLAQTVEESIRSQGSSVVTTDEVGKAILEPLRQLDEVAYLRFASVYSNFDSIDDFEHIIGQLRASDQK